MITALARFVEAMRHEGVQVSPAEVVDAGRAIEHLGLEDRERFRSALRATLAKSRARAEVLDRVFDRFFVAPSRASRRRGRGERGGGTGTGARVRLGEQIDARGRPHFPETTSPRTTPGRLRATDARKRPAPQAGLPDGAPRPGAEVQAPPPAPLGPRRVRLRGESGSDDRGPGGPADPAHRDLTRPMPEAEERRLAEHVPRLIETLRLRVGRRHRRDRRGRVWTQRLFRENLSTGGAPFVLPFRRPRPRPTRVVLLVDVSFSAARAAGFFLWMASAFVRVGRRTRVIAFVDRPVDVTRAVTSWTRRRGRRDVDPATSNPVARRAASAARRPGSGIRPASRTFADLIESVRDLNLSAPSDYGRMLHTLLTSRLRPHGRDTLLVVLGDARTNRFDSLPWALEELSRRCQGVVWLASEPRQRWGTGDSALMDYLPYIDTLVEAWDLAGLARGVSELTRRL